MLWYNQAGVFTIPIDLLHPRYAMNGCNALENCLTFDSEC